tara:strand:+ start:137 stop:403 length:267 start_codon:yes stop_codon:yes gene_type:complete
MCRNIKTLFNFEPPATTGEIQAASLQFVRKVSGYRQPSKVNADAFDKAVNEVSRAVDELLRELVTDRPSLDREVEAAKAKARAAKRFA